MLEKLKLFLRYISPSLFNQRKVHIQSKHVVKNSFIFYSRSTTKNQESVGGKLLQRV